jgi:hypothetical protein
MKSKDPSTWLRAAGTQELIEAFRRQTDNPRFAFEAPVRTFRGGTNPGTWAATDLAIACAQFRSPEFHLRTTQEWRAWQAARNTSPPAPGLSRADVPEIVRELVPIIVELVRPQVTPRPSATPTFGTPLIRPFKPDIELMVLGRVSCMSLARHNEQAARGSCPCW